MEKGYEEIYQQQALSLYESYAESGRSFLLPTSTQLKEIKPFFKEDYVINGTPVGQFLTVRVRHAPEGHRLYPDMSYLQTLVSLDDEWFVAYIEDTMYKGTYMLRGFCLKGRWESAGSRIYKCDQFDGLMQCLKDNINI